MDPRDLQLDSMDPGQADQVRDALALVKCWLDQDEQGARVILAALDEQDGPALEAVTRVLAAIAGMAMRDLGIRPEWVTGFHWGPG
jgi:hypothetical protein